MKGKTSRRKPTSKKKATGSRAKSQGVKASASSATKKFNGQVFRKRSCSTTKTGAKKTAEGLRKKGKKARVVKVAKGYCVYTRG